MKDVFLFWNLDVLSVVPAAQQVTPPVHSLIIHFSAFHSCTALSVIHECRRPLSSPERVHVCLCTLTGWAAWAASLPSSPPSSSAPFAPGCSQETPILRWSSSAVRSTYVGQHGWPALSAVENRTVKTAAVSCLYSWWMGLSLEWIQQEDAASSDQ